MENYEINKGTMCLIQENFYKTKIIEENFNYTVEKNINKIIEDSCKCFGCTYKGRSEGTKKLTGIKYKVPIIISEYLSIIMIPTGSTRGDICHWINLSYIKKVDKDEKGMAIINFTNGKSIKIEVSYYIVENQIAKALKLNYLLNQKY